MFFDNLNILHWRLSPCLWWQQSGKNTGFLGTQCRRYSNQFVARGASWSLAFAGCMIFWSWLFLGVYFPIFSLLLQQFDIINCWYGWAFGDSLIMCIHFRKTKNVWDKTLLQYSTDFLWDVKAGHPQICVAFVSKALQHCNKQKQVFFLCCKMVCIRTKTAQLERIGCKSKQN